MPDVSGAGTPSLSQIVNWDTSHLEDAARHWMATAEQWEDHFTVLHNEMLSPGGTAWEGAGAEAAQERTFADLVKVRGAADHLNGAAAAARYGASEISDAKNLALDAIAEAQEAGFSVGEDLSVTDSMLLGNLRATQAQQHAAAITTRATNLSALDQQVAAKISTAAAPLGEISFTEPADAPPNVQPVDFKQAPPPTNPPYPINDVIAEATDLDGNHVVMRRGYYESAWVSFRS